MQYTQFNLIGITNGIIDIASFNLLLWLWPTEQGGLLLLYNSISYFLAVLNSYIWNARFTFRDNVKKGWSKQKIWFVLQAIASLFISNLTFFLGNQLLNWIGLPKWLVDNVAKGLAMFVSATASFIFMKWIVFRKGKARSN
ncbi:GtrA family protein [Tuberibacillus sp. Marseille-P3662]|uniref:GtrA family protein n=1 Tax=Tuberibacillus sp. Marseille-P3662 TaxID=1965358 RepID=UPI0020CB407D|nr:GtrA family protein [Tuberibacillus sp. Marseille-P3662]